MFAAKGIANQTTKAKDGAAKQHNKQYKMPPFKDVILIVQINVYAFCRHIFYCSFQQKKEQ